MRFRILQDGSLIFPNKGQGPPNKDIPNYKIDPTDPFHYIPELPKCIYRRTSIVGLRPCGLPVFKEICDKNFSVSLEQCVFCNERCEDENFKNVPIDPDDIGNK